MSPEQAVEKAAQLVGSKAALARQLGVRPPTVSQWIAGDRPVPPARAVEIEKLTNGEVRREVLSPGFPWEVAA